MTKKITCLNRSLNEFCISNGKINQKTQKKITFFLNFLKTIDVLLVITQYTRVFYLIIVCVGGLSGRHFIFKKGDNFCKIY
jgi:hypothetical protein